ncbi:replication factor A2 [Kwoniella heveanensis CBS 569]|nr:replication factor A2 [Kwoniella heveanensis CBS 569]
MEPYSDMEYLAKFPDDGQNPYYGGGGGDGGGFVPGGSPYGSQESPGRGKTRGNQTIRPVTIKQVLNATQVHPDADFQIDGQDISQILLVGSVHNSSASATNVSYEIGDGTGYIDVRLWLDSADDEAGKAKDIEQDHYVGIMGSIKMFGGKRHVSATHIRAITNHDEVYHHLLKSLYVSLSMRGASSGGGGVSGATHDDYSAGVQSNNAESAFAGLPTLQRKIMEYVAQDDTDDGVHVSLITRQVTGFKSDDVMEAVEQLMSDGLLFSTIDDLHVKSTS